MFLALRLTAHRVPLLAASAFGLILLGTPTLVAAAGARKPPKVHVVEGVVILVHRHLPGVSVDVQRVLFKKPLAELSRPAVVRVAAAAQRAPF